MYGFDTSGEVSLNAWVAKRLRPSVPSKVFRWTDLNPFTQGYVEALFAGPIEDITREDIRCGTYGFSDLAPETWAQIMEDCERIQRGNLWYGIGGADRGAAFWKARQEGDLRGNFPPLTPYLGDDGKAYLRDAPSPSSDRGGS